MIRKETPSTVQDLERRIARIEQLLDMAERRTNRSAFEELMQRETSAALAHADKQDEMRATGKFHVTSPESGEVPITGLCGGDETTAAIEQQNRERKLLHAMYEALEARAKQLREERDRAVQDVRALQLKEAQLEVKIEELQRGRDQTAAELRRAREQLAGYVPADIEIRECMHGGSWVAGVAATIVELRQRCDRAEAALGAARDLRKDPRD